MAASQAPALPSSIFPARSALGEGAELSEDSFGERFGVAARHRAEQDQLKELVVGKRIGAGFAEAPPQPLAMAEIVGLAAASLKPIRGRTIAE
jgi:hypothetical protein